MPIESQCTGCGKTLRVDDMYAGRNARCPMCGAVYLVPSPALSNVNPYVEPRAFDPLRSFDPRNTSLGAFDASPTISPLEQQIDPRAANDSLYYAQTPNGSVYGPVNAATIESWLVERRLNESCLVRPEKDPNWIALGVWRMSLQSNSPSSNVNANISVHVNPYADQRQAPGAYQFGQIPTSNVQSVGYQRSGNGAVVLTLGLVSWLMCFSGIGALICGVIAIVMGLNDLRAMDRGEISRNDRTITLIGLWLAIVNIALCCILIVFFVGAIILGN